MAPDKIQRSGDPGLRDFVTQEEVQAWLDELDARKPGLGRIVLNRALQNGVFSRNGEFLAREWLDSHPARTDRRQWPDRRGKRRWTLRFWDPNARRVSGRRSSDHLGLLPGRTTLLTAIGTLIIFILMLPAFQGRKPAPPVEVRQYPIEPREPR